MDQGLVAVHKSEGMKVLANCVRYIAFFGTPFQGSNKAKWAQTIKTFCIFLEKSNNKVLEDLDKKSVRLVKLGKDFPSELKIRGQSPRNPLDIHCFYEGFDTMLKGIDIGKAR